MSQKVAILIPTKNRIDFVIRSINYYVSINSPHPLFIGDASSESSEELVLKAAQDKIEIYYFHWENLIDRKTLSKLAQEASKTNITDYCAYQGDDDFFVSKSLSLCAEFLSENPSYATAQGRAFTIRLNNDSPYGDVADLCVYWDRKELKEDSALERLNEISVRYWVPMFSVHRINEFIDDYSNGLDTVTDMRFGEFVNSLSIAIRGKSKFIDCLYLARGIHRNQYGRLKGIKDHGVEFEWITGKKWYISYTELVNSLTNVLSKKDNLSLSEANREVKLAIERLLGLDKTLNPSLRFQLKIKYEKLLKKYTFVNLLSNLYRRIKFIDIFPSKNFSQRSLLSSKSKYYKDISFIVSACKKIS